jgi:hypothetical protein
MRNIIGRKHTTAGYNRKIESFLRIFIRKQLYRLIKKSSENIRVFISIKIIEIKEKITERCHIQILPRGKKKQVYF